MEERLKILVVDEDDLARKVFRSVVEETRLSLELWEVSDSKNVFCVLESARFDCIFLGSPLVDGTLTLIDKLHFSQIKVPLVILTSPGEEKTALNLLHNGATDYLNKSSLTPEILSIVLRNAIRLHQSETKAQLAYSQLKESHEKLIRSNDELERQRQQIQLQNLKLLEVSRLKSQFLSTISHELRTPMNAIIGFAQILLRPKFSQLSSVQMDMLKRILNNAKDLSMLLNEVLDFSKIDSGRLGLKPEIFDLSKMVNHTVGEIRSLVEAKKLSLSVEIDLENTLVFNDPVRVRQILINLLSNAIKFTERGCVWVRVTETSKSRIAISIRDTGIGISNQDCEHIFEAFRQVDQGMSRKYPGTGLGLAIIDSLVKIMGGKIMLESQLAVGSLFTVELPRQVSVNSLSEEKLSYLEKKGRSMSVPEKWRARY